MNERPALCAGSPCTSVFSLNQRVSSRGLGEQGCAFCRPRCPALCLAHPDLGGDRKGESRVLSVVLKGTEK